MGDDRFFYNDLKQNLKIMDAIELAVWTHSEFVRIHPFVDGNGKICELTK